MCTRVEIFERCLVVCGRWRLGAGACVVSVVWVGDAEHNRSVFTDTVDGLGISEKVEN